MTGRQTLSEIEDLAESNPESISYQTLYSYLVSEDIETQQRALSVYCTRTIPRFIESPSLIFEALVDILSTGEESLVSLAQRVLLKLTVEWPQNFVSHIVELVSSPNPQLRLAGVRAFGRGSDGLFAPYLDTVGERLSDTDPKIMEATMSTLVQFSLHYPERVAPYIESVSRVLDAERVPDDNSRKAYPDLGVTKLLENTGSVRPTALSPVLPRICDIVVTIPSENVRYTPLIRILALALRADVDEVMEQLPELKPALRTHATSTDRRRRIAARSLLSDLGHEIDHPPAVEVPPMATRDRPKQPDDDEFLGGIDIRATEGSEDIDAIIERLHCSDSHVRDTTAWGLECGFHRYRQELFVRSQTLLSLFNEPHDCTRSHLSIVFHGVASDYPEEWTPALLELTTHADSLVRAAATARLSTVATVYPALIANKIEMIESRLDDESRVVASAFSALGSYAQVSPAVASRHVDVASSVISSATLTDEALEDNDAVHAAMKFLRSLAKVRPESVHSVVNIVVDVVTELAGPESVADRAKRESASSYRVESTDELLKTAFEVCAWVGKYDADALVDAQPCADRIAEDHYWGRKEAMRVLTVFDE